MRTRRLSVRLFLSLMLGVTGVVADDGDGPEVLVVGAGIAGLSAALEAADQGARVSLVEASSVFP